MLDFTDHLKPAHDGTATLRAEREASKINVNELAKHLLDRDGFLDRQDKVLKVLSQEKLFKKDQELNLARPERYHLGLARAKAIQRIVRRENWGEKERQMAEYLTDEMSPYFLHSTMFGELIFCVELGRWEQGWWQLNLPCSFCFFSLPLSDCKKKKGFRLSQPSISDVVLILFIIFFVQGKERFEFHYAFFFSFP